MTNLLNRSRLLTISPGPLCQGNENIECSASDVHGHTILLQEPRLGMQPERAKACRSVLGTVTDCGNVGHETSSCDQTASSSALLFARAARLYVSRVD